MRLFLTMAVAGAGFFLSGCADTAQQAGLQKERDANAACISKFSESDRDAVARAKCFNDADEIYKTVFPYPDLLAVKIAKRTELAERQAAGKITRAQVELEMSTLVAQLTSEAQRRRALAIAAVVADMSPVTQQPTFTPNPSIYTLHTQPPPPPIAVPVPTLGSVYTPPMTTLNQTPAERLRDCAQTSSCAGAFPPGQ